RMTQLAAYVRRIAVQFLYTIFKPMNERPGMLLENQTPRGKQNPLPAALKQRHAKTCFQIPHLLRDARLRNSEPVGSAAKASRFGDREKIAKVTNIQRLRHGKRQYCSAGSAN